MAGTIAELLVKLGVRLDGSVKAQDGLRKLKKRAHEFGAEADTTRAKVKRLAAGVGRALVAGLKAGAVAIGVYGLALGRMVLNKAEAIDATNKLSAALGTNIEDLQRLKFAAGQSGLTDANLEKGIRNLNKAMTEMSQGAGGVAAKAFDDLGLSLEKLDGKSQADQIGLIGDALNGISDEGRRSALAAQIFGQRAGPEMASLLAQGSTGLKDLMAQTRGVFSQEQADQASAMQDRMGELKNTLGALTTGIAVELIPTVTEWIQLAQAWFERNEDIIRQDFAATVDFVVTVVKNLAAEGAALVDIVDAMADAFTRASGRGDALSGIIEGMAWVFTQATKPLQNVRTLLGELAYLLEDFGVISTRTADEFNLSIGNMETSSTGLDRIAGKYDNLADSAYDAAAAMKMAKAAELLYGEGTLGPLSEEDMARAKKLEEEARNQRPPRRRRGGGGGGGSKTKTKKPKAAKAEAKGVTLAQLRDRLLGGDFSAMNENLSGLSSATSMADTKPSVNINYTDNSMTIGRVDMHVDGAGDPAATGRAAADALTSRAILQDNAKTARTIIPPVVR